MAYFDRFGVEFSDDKKTLLKFPNSFEGGYSVPYGTAFIKDFAFNDCSYLNAISIPSSVKQIGRHAFSGCCCDLEHVELSNGVISIGECAFFSCDNLRSITIPGSVKEIGGKAFAGCYNLEQIIVEKNNTVYDSRNNCNAIIKTDTNTLIQGCKKTKIPEDIVCIDHHAFSGCWYLSDISVPRSVRVIKDFAFADCAIRVCLLPEHINTIGDRVFWQCEKLELINFHAGITKIGEDIFHGCNSIREIGVPKGLKGIFLEMGLKDYENKIVEI